MRGADRQRSESNKMDWLLLKQGERRLAALRFEQNGVMSLAEMVMVSQK